MRQRWVVISNCQTVGLANSVEALARDIDCTGVDVHEFRRIVADERDHFRHYDYALVLPEAIEGIEADLPPHRLVPAFQFPAYHPDSVYVFADGAFFPGVIDMYQSMIALAAFKEGLDAERAATFFTGEVYRRAGYYAMWEPFRDWLIAHFGAAQIDVTPLFLRRARGRALMHTVNHPAIEVLFDIARTILVQMEQPIHEAVPPPPDNLAAVAWPIYPEVGERLGLAGAYLFKPAYRQKPLTLVEYLDESLRLFAARDRSELSVIPNLVQPLRRVRRIMRDAA